MNRAAINLLVSLEICVRYADSSHIIETLAYYIDVDSWCMMWCHVDPISVTILSAPHHEANTRVKRVKNRNGGADSADVQCDVACYYHYTVHRATTS